MVGASLAYMLSSTDLTIAIIESYPVESDEQPSFDARTTALSNGSRQILTALGLWDDLAAQATLIRSIHVSESGRFGRASISAEELALPAMGYVVANRAIGRELWRRLRLNPRVHLISPAQVSSLQTQPDCARLTMSHEGCDRVVQAKLVVAADGANSLIRSQAGVALNRHDYEQTAIVTSVSPGVFHAHVAYERFTAEGPLAVLPQADGRCVVILTVTPAVAKQVMNLPEKEFLALVQDRFGWRLGEFTGLGRRDAYALALTAAKQSTGPRLALIGSAAQGLHPIAGQGFNLGLRDAATLAEVLSDALSDQHSDLGVESVLNHYAQWRQADRRALISFTDGLVRLFKSALAPVRFGRTLGLLAFDVSLSAKSALAGLSRGFSTVQPRLARGLDLRGQPKS